MKEITLLFFILSLFTATGQVINFPDPVLESKLVSYSSPAIDLNGDGQIQISEANSFNGILNLSYDFSSSKISDVSGLENFKAVTALHLKYNSISSFDFSSMTSLEHLDLSDNNISSISDSWLPASLKILYLNNNTIGNINISNLPSLETIWLMSNSLSSFDFSGLTSLKNLYLDNNNLSSIDSSILPISLEILFLANNQTNSINFSSLVNLKDLRINQNNLTYLDNQNLPSSVEVLSLSSNNIINESSLNLTGLTNLKILDASGNFTSFSGSYLPTSLEELILKSSNLTSFTLPANLTNLKNLDISYNSISSVGANLSSLETFKAYSNNLNSIDLSNYTMLEELELGENNLDSLNVSNNLQLKSLGISNNNLVHLEYNQLPNLTALLISSNQFTSFNFSGMPALVHCFASDNLFTQLDFSSNPNLSGDLAFSNLPNLEYLNLKNGNDTPVAWINSCPNLEVVCVDDVGYYDDMLDLPFTDTDATFTTYCNFTPGQYNTVHGNLILDTGLGCTDSSAVEVSNTLVSASQNNILVSGNISNEAGEYTLYMDNGSFEISMSSNLPSYYSINTNPINVNFSGYGNSENIDFCITANQVVNDLNITLVPITPSVPGFISTYKIVYSNVGTTVLNGQVSLQYDSNLQTYVNSSQNQNSTTSNTLFFDFNNLIPFETREIKISLLNEVPPLLNQNDVLNFTAYISPNQNDLTPVDNTFSYSQTVVNSYDPNDKQVLEGSKIYVNEVDNYLNYIIRFQNTGTANVQNAIVTDTLSDLLDLNTLKIVSASDDYRVHISNGNFVEYIFEGIDLPYESADEEGSKGYIAFKIKPKENVTTGNIISGDAAIYFDFNQPIITNEVSTEIVENLSTPSEDPFDQIYLYPNPVEEVLHISSKSRKGIKSVEVYSLTGQKVFSEVSTNRINFINLSPGIYFIKLVAENGFSLTKKVVKK